MASKAVQQAIKVVNSEASVICQQQLKRNVWAYNSRCSPNADKLTHGAIQRQSVAVPENRLAFTHMNPEKIGVYKRPELNAKASSTCRNWMAPWDTQLMRNRVVRIYMHQRKHLHCHPTDKTDGKGWTIQFDNWGSYKSPLMGWTNGSHDGFNNTKMSFGKLQDAVAYVESNGWGYDI